MKAKLKKDLEKAVKGYTVALQRQWGYSEPATADSFWVGNDCTGVWCWESQNIFLNLSDVVYCVENDVPLEVVEEWSEYCSNATEHGFNVPNLPSFHKGCPRVSKEAFKRLQSLKNNIRDLCELEKKKLDGEDE